MQEQLKRSKGGGAIEKGGIPDSGMPAARLQREGRKVLRTMEHGETRFCLGK